MFIYERTLTEHSLSIMCASGKMSLLSVMYYLLHKVHAISQFISCLSNKSTTLMETKIITRVFTCIGRRWRSVGAVRAVNTVRWVETEVVRLCVVRHGAGRVSVILVRAQLSKWRAVARLLVVVIAAVRRRGHRQGRGLLRFMQTVVIAWGNLVRMHIGI